MKRRSMTVAGLAIAIAGLSGCASPPTTKEAAREVLPFVADDYARALSEAKARKLPIFVECWAPW